MRMFAFAAAAVMALTFATSPALAKDNGKTPPGQSKDPPGQSNGGNSGNNGQQQQPPTPTFTMTPCATAGAQIGALACRGWFEGNLNAEGLGNGTLTERTKRASELNILVGSSVFDAATLVPMAKINTSGPTINFGQTLYGLTVVGFHVGGAGGGGGIGYQGTAFYLFDAGTTGIASFNFVMPGLSNAALYATGKAPPPIPPVVAVPEPASWALMILGFGTAGAMLRRRRALTA